VECDAGDVSDTERSFVTEAARQPFSIVDYLQGAIDRTGEVTLIRSLAIHWARSEYTGSKIQIVEGSFSAAFGGLVALADERWRSACGQKHERVCVRPFGFESSNDRRVTVDPFERHALRWRFTDVSNGMDDGVTAIELIAPAVRFEHVGGVPVDPVDPRFNEIGPSTPSDASNRVPVCNGTPTDFTPNEAIPAGNEYATHERDSSAM
jgi:hypothetical protein